MWEDVSRQDTVPILKGWPALVGCLSWFMFFLHVLSCRVCWVLSTAINCMKDRSERVFGSTRDLLYIFLLFVACQVDGQTNYSWKVVFVVPWIWFSSLFLLAWMVSSGQRVPLWFGQR